jgi:hypothetical protein
MSPRRIDDDRRYDHGNHAADRSHILQVPTALEIPVACTGPPRLIILAASGYARRHELGVIRLAHAG